MIIDLISDLHGSYPKLKGGDLLIIAGDITATDSIQQWEEFYIWLENQSYRKKIYIAGNHDGFLEQCISSKDQLDLYKEFQDEDIKPSEDFEYLCDSSTEFEGLKIWGTPWTPEFCDWHFMACPEKRKEIFSSIPDDIDILISHGPPWGIRDECECWDAGKIINVGCVNLRTAVERIKAKLHVFGHIHEGYGSLILKREGHDTLCVNASIMDECYYPSNSPVRVIYENGKMRIEKIVTGL